MMLFFRRGLFLTASPRPCERNPKQWVAYYTVIPMISSVFILYGLYLLFGPALARSLTATGGLDPAGALQRIEYIIGGLVWTIIILGIIYINVYTSRLNPDGTWKSGTSHPAWMISHEPKR